MSAPTITPDTVAAHLASLGGVSEIDQFIRQAKLLTAGQIADEKVDLQALDLDFATTPDPPDWLVRDVLERGTVGLFAGDTGAGKSLVTSSLVVAALRGEDWLGHASNIERVLVIDEENPDRLVLARLRAMGADHAVSQRLRYVSRQGVSIGDDSSDVKLERLIASFRPDLVVVDTLMSAAAGIDVNSNSDAVRLMKQLRSMAVRHNLGVLVLHHERKASQDGTYAAGSSQQTMGARQWIGQADALMTIAVETDMATEDTDDGGLKLRRTFKFRPAEKDRDGRPQQHRRLAVESEKDPQGRLLTMAVLDEGPIANDGAQEEDERRIIQALRDGELGRTELATACGQKNPASPAGTFKRAVKGLAERGLIDSPKRGRYALTEEGRSAELGLAI